jgi:hypothetical protein
MRANTPTMGRMIFFLVEGLSGSAPAVLPVREAPLVGEDVGGEASVSSAVAIVVPVSLLVRGR